MSQQQQTTNGKPGLGGGAPPPGAKVPPKRPPLTIKQLLEASQKSLAAAAGRWLDADRLLRIATGSIQKNAKLAACTPQSFLGSIIQCAEWGVYPGTGMLAQAFLIPYKGECQAQLSYQGLLTQVRRAAKGNIVDVEARSVYEGETFDFVLGFKPRLEHVPDTSADRDPEEMPLLVYSLARFKDAEYPHVEWMSWQKILKRRAASKSADNADSPWKLWPEEMGKKTVLRDLCKALPNYQDLEGAIAKDDEGDTVEGVVTARGEPGISAPAARPYEVQTARRSLPEETFKETLDFAPRGEPVPVGQEEDVDPQTGEVFEQADPAVEQMQREQAELEARMRKADEEAKAAEAAKQAAPPPAPKMPMLDMSAPDAREQLKAAMHLVAADATATPKQLEKLAALGSELPTEQQAEIGTLYIQLRKSMLARKA